MRPELFWRFCLTAVVCLLVGGYIIEYRRQYYENMNHRSAISPPDPSCDDITSHYTESAKRFTAQGTFVARLRMKTAEQSLEKCEQQRKAFEAIQNKPLLPNPFWVLSTLLSGFIIGPLQMYCTMMGQSTHEFLYGLETIDKIFIGLLVVALFYIYIRYARSVYYKSRPTNIYRREFDDRVFPLYTFSAPPRFENAADLTRTFSTSDSVKRLSEDDSEISLRRRSLSRTWS